MLSRMNLTLFQRIVFSTLILGPGKGFPDTVSRLLRCSQMALACLCTQHIISYAFAGEKFVVTYIIKLGANPLLCVTLRCWNTQLHLSYSLHLVY